MEKRPRRHDEVLAISDWRCRGIRSIRMVAFVRECLAGFGYDQVDPVLAVCLRKQCPDNADSCRHLPDSGSSAEGTTGRSRNCVYAFA